MRQFDSETSKEFRSNEVQYSRVIVEVDGEILDDTFYNGEHLLLDANGSSIQYDRTSEARTTGNFRFVAKTDEGADALDPMAGAILYPMAGTIVNGVALWTPLGKLIIHETDRRTNRDYSEVGVALVDLTEKIRDQKFREPFQTGGGTYIQAIEDIMDDRAPGIAPFKLYFYNYSETAPEVTYVESDDPWSSIFNLAVSSRSEIWFDKNGYINLDEVPDPADQIPAYTLGGSEFKTEIGRRGQVVSRRDVYNGVICRGEAPWLLFPISGEYWDDNPASPTYRGGPFGEKPYMMGSPVATTDAQCEEIAETEFRRLAGVTEKVTFNMLKDPILEVGLVVAVSDEPGEDDRFFILDTLTYPMGAQPMSGDIRRKRL